MGRGDNTDDDKQRQIDELKAKVEQLHHGLFDKEFVNNVAGLVSFVKILMKIFSLLIGAILAVAVGYIVDLLKK